MAVVFEKDISTNDLLLAYVNNVVVFYSDSATPVLKAEITFMTFTKVLFPGPDGKFYFNFIDWITALINSDNFADDLNLDIVDSGYLYDWSEKIYRNDDCYFTIFYSNNTNEQALRNLKWLSGLVQLEDFKRKYPINVGASNLFLLSPFRKANTTSTYVKYWRGLPFDLAIYVPDTSQPINVKNKTNLLQYNFENPFTITRLAFSDGNDDTTIEDVLSLSEGFNELEFANGDKKYYALVEKMHQDCGHYLKWINEFGGWNYWLFYDGGRARSAKDMGELENNFYNVPETISPIVQIGRTSADTLTVATDQLTPAEVLLIEGIFDSPKVYLFTGEKYAKNSFNDWLEVSLKSTGFKPDLPKNDFNRFEFQIDLPQRYTRTL